MAVEEAVMDPVEVPVDEALDPGEELADVVIEVVADVRAHPAKSPRAYDAMILLTISVAPEQLPTTYSSPSMVNRSVGKLAVPNENASSIVFMVLRRRERPAAGAVMSCTELSPS